MGASAEETSVQANAVSAAAEQVSANVNTVATSAEEMAASIREIATNATEAAGVASAGRRDRRERDHAPWRSSARARPRSARSSR